MPISPALTVDPALAAKAAPIKMLVLDVDGVLTDGALYFGNEGEQLKRFSILDGLGIKLLADCGIETAIITGRRSQMVLKRAAELGIGQVIQGREDKLTALEELSSTRQLPLSDIAYVGDDLPDLKAIQAAGLGIAVANAYPVVKQFADWTCSTGGGSGAVREAADLLLIAQGHYERVVGHYITHPITNP